MAVAHDTQTRFPATDGTTGVNSVDTTTGDRTFSHAGAAGAAAAVVAVLCTGNAPVVTGVLYGGVQMGLVRYAIDTSEAGRVDLYVLEGGIPTGTQTVTLQGCTATAKWACCSTVTGTLVAMDGSNLKDTTTAANPQVNITNAATAMAYGAFHSGAAAPATTGIAGCTVQRSNDYGALCANTVRWTSPTAAGTTAIGVTIASDDYCGAAVSFSEFAPAANTAYRVPGSEKYTRIESVTDPWSVDGPPHAAAGDMVVLALSFFDAETDPDSYTGFTLGPGAEEGLNDGRGRMLYGPYDTVGAGPYSIGFPSTAEGLAIATAIRNVDMANPLNVASTALDDATAGVTWTVTGQTTGAAGCCLVGVGGASPNGTLNSWRITAGTIQRQSVQTISENHVITLGTLNQAAGGSVTTSGDNSQSQTTYGLQMAFSPAPPPAGGTRQTLMTTGIGS